MSKSNIEKLQMTIEIVLAKQEFVNRLIVTPNGDISYSDVSFHLKARCTRTLDRSNKLNMIINAKMYKLFR